MQHILAQDMLALPCFGISPPVQADVTLKFIDSCPVRVTDALE